MKLTLLACLLLAGCPSDDSFEFDTTWEALTLELPKPDRSHVEVSIADPDGFIVRDIFAQVVVGCTVEAPVGAIVFHTTTSLVCWHHPL